MASSCRDHTRTLVQKLSYSCRFWWKSAEVYRTSFMHPSGCKPKCFELFWISRTPVDHLSRKFLIWRKLVEIYWFVSCIDLFCRGSSTLVCCLPPCCFWLKTNMPSWRKSFVCCLWWSSLNLWISLCLCIVSIFFEMLFNTALRILLLAWALFTTGLEAGMLPASEPCFGSSAML